MVQLYEDQILRGKDMTARADLARKVARMWEEQLADPREAADAWRRVLRMKQGDPEATSGLDRAKSNMLKKPEPGAEREAYAPPKLQTNPPAAPVETKKPTDPAPPAEASDKDDSTAPHKPDQLAASLRAALAPEPEVSETNGEPSEAPETDNRPQRPEGLFFRSNAGEEATVSAPGTQPEIARTTQPADEEELAVIERTFAPAGENDELMRTSEGSAVDFLDATLARPPKLSEPPPPPLGDTGENEIATSAGVAEDFEEEVIIADDLAEMIDAPEEEEDRGPATEKPPEPPPSKRSIPPPIPRH